MKATSKQRTTLLIDIAGGAVFAVMLTVSICLTVVESGKASQRIKATRGAIESTETALRTMETEHIQLEHDLADRRDGDAAETTLPDQQATEAFFQSLSSLAAKHELRVLRQSPLGVQQYPGIVERQFAFELAGAVPRIASFLRAFEQREDWADIAYIDLGGAVTGSDAAHGDRSASLTVSLYAAADEQKAEPGGTNGTATARRAGS